MKFKKYGITLSRITEADIELIRQWRNHPDIMKTMQFREYITPEMQKKWFDSIDNKYDHYYLIQFKDEKIGLINNKNIDWEKQTSEAGIFIWDNSYSFAPLLASILLCEIGFYIVQGHGHGGVSFINVLRDNKAAMDYNKLLGYEVYEDDPAKNTIRFILTRESFEKHTRKLREAALKLTGGDSTIYLILEKHDYDSGYAQLIESIEKNFFLEHDIRFENGEKIYSIYV